MTPGEPVPGLFKGFEGYRSTSDDDLVRVFREGIVALDTNVLLDLYRYGEKARGKFFAILESFASTLWIPHQVVKEFWRNRVSVIAEVGSAAQVPDLKKSKNIAISALTSWGGRARAEEETQRSIALLEEAYRDVADTLSSVTGLDTGSIGLDTTVDPVLARLEPLTLGHVGEAPTEAELTALILAGAARFEALRPPGYMDGQKHGQTEQGTGDFLLWHQLIGHARNLQREVVLITRDEKEDWWQLDGSRRLIGPRVELVQEMLEHAGVRFHLLHPERLLRVAPALLGVAIDADTLEDVTRISQSADVDGSLPPGWTPGAVSHLLEQLRKVGGQVQASVIEAAAVAGGWISRERVFELGGYDEARHLKGFTRPVRSVVESMTDAGLLPDTAEMPLVPTYPGPGKADGFEVPDAVVQALAPSGKQLTWLAAAERVMADAEVEWWTVDEVLTAIRAAGFRDMTYAQTPKDTLRRDLRLRGVGRFEEVDGMFRLAPPHDQ